MTKLLSLLLLLFMRLFFGWRPCFLGFSVVAGVPALAGVHLVASFPALAGVPEITGVPAVATIPAVTDNQ